MQCMCCWLLVLCLVFFLNVTAPTWIYTYCHPLSLHDPLPILHGDGVIADVVTTDLAVRALLMRIMIGDGERVAGERLADLFGGQRREGQGRPHAVRADAILAAFAGEHQRQRLVETGRKIGRAHV